MHEDIKYVEGNPDQPVTRADFNEALVMITDTFANTATKTDLQNLEERLREEASADKADILAKIDQLGQDLRKHIDAAVESRQIDLGAAKRDQVSLLGDKVHQHEERLARLEKQLGQDI